VVRGAAGDDHDAAEILDLELRQPDAFEDELAPPSAVSDRLADRGGLLVDLLEHERLVAALLRDFVVPVDRLDLLVLHLAVLGEEARALGSDRDDLALVDQLHLPCLAQERGDSGREEHLTVTHPDDERTLPARTDEQVGMVVVDDDEREVAFELVVGGADCGDQVAGVVTLDEMRHDFRVGRRAERVSVSLERPLELAEVLDDAVQHHGDTAVVTARERMRVLLVDGAVRRPTRVAETVVRGRVIRAGGGFEVAQVADRTDVVEPAVLAQRDPGRVVAAVLEPLEPTQQQVLRRPATDVSDDPAHPKPPSGNNKARPMTRPSVGTISRALVARGWRC
jgi:hypothetical protein